MLSLIARRNFSRAAASVSRVSASTMRRSVPAAGSALPKTATQPRRTPGNVADRLLEFVGINVAAAADDQILDAAGEKDLAADQIRVVAGVEPFAVEQLARLIGVAVVAAGRRRSP